MKVNNMTEKEPDYLKKLKQQVGVTTPPDTTAPTSNTRPTSQNGPTQNTRPATQTNTQQRVQTQQTGAVGQRKQVAKPKAPTPNATTGQVNKVGTTVNDVKQQRVKAKAKPTAPEVQKEEVTDYLNFERLNGIGLGVEGIGRLVHLEETLNSDGENTFEYRLRRPKEKPRVANANGDNCKDAKPRVPLPLIEEVGEIFSNRLGLSGARGISNIDTINLALVAQIQDRTLKELLGNAIANSSKGIRKSDDVTRLFHSDGAEGNVSDELVNSLINALDKQSQTLRRLEQQNKYLHEQNNQLLEQNGAVIRTLAYQEGVRTGLVGATRINDTKELEGALVRDETTRVVNSMLRIGTEEWERQEKIRVDKLRRGMK